MDVRVPLGQREVLEVLRRAEVGDHRGQARMRREHLAERARPGVRAGERAAAAVHDDRASRLGEHSPHRLEQLVARVVAADLHVRLEDPRARVERLARRSDAADGSG